MNKRDAKRRAHGFAYARLQEWLDSSWDNDLEHGDDAVKIEDAMNELAQRHFELSLHQQQRLDR